MFGILAFVVGDVLQDVASRPVVQETKKRSLAKPLAMVFNQLLSVSAVPSEWKKAIIIPVFTRDSCTGRYC